MRLHELFEREAMEFENPSMFLKYRLDNGSFVAQPGSICPLSATALLSDDWRGWDTYGNLIEEIPAPTDTDAPPATEMTFESVHDSGWYKWFTQGQYEEQQRNMPDSRDSYERMLLRGSK